MESWHSTKINKYLALKTTIESNGWSVELFAVEVGARGYCSKSVLCCLKKLGLSSTRDTPFDFNSQQDLAEILQVVLDELKDVSLAASSLISNTLRTTVCLATLAYVPLFQ